MEQQRAQEIDTELARLHGEGQLAAHQRKILTDRLHRVTGDTQTGDRRGRPSWQDTDRQSAERAERMIAEGRDNDLRYGPGVISRTIKGLTELTVEQQQLAARILNLEYTYHADPWNRYYLVTNSNGHVHKNMSCSSCFPDTEYHWLVELAAQPADEMISDYGEKACTICFPDAPANPAHRGPGRIDREAQAAKDAEKAARQDARNAKQLAEDEIFRSRHGERITTVAACRSLVSKPAETAAELAWYEAGKSGWSDPAAEARVIGNITLTLAQQREDARQAAAVLLDREARHEGWGATQAQIEKIIANKARKAAKDWA